MITKSIISRQPNGQISITYFDDQDDLNDIIQKHIVSCGKTFIEAVDGIIEKPAEHRDCWDYENGKIKIDSVLLENKTNTIAQKEAEKSSVLSKLGITSEELKSVIDDNVIKG